MRIRNRQNASVMAISAAVGGVRGLRQPPRSVHLLLPLRTQHDRAFRVDECRVQNPDVHDVE